MSLGGYLLAETGKSIWRNKLSSFLSCGTTALALFLLGVAFIVRLNLGFTLEVVQQQMEVQAYLQRELCDSDCAAVFEAVQAMPGVAEVTYVSKADALEQMKEWFQDKSAVLDGLGEDNPLPASIRVTMTDISLIPGLVEEIRLLEGIDDVQYQDEAAARLQSLGAISQAVSLGGMVIVGLVAIMVIGNSIKLTIDAKRHEIAIMKLVGATDEFIVGPFILTGVVLGVLGGVLGASFAIGLYTWVASAVQAAVPFVPVLNLTLETGKDMLIVMLSTGVVVGVLGSTISIRRYLRV
mgnify:FL=1|jgi:cell division transport system permease protein